MSTIQFFDPTVRAMHESREAVFHSVSKTKGTVFSEWEKSHGTIASFLEVVRFKGKNLQEATVNPIPPENELEKQKQEVLRLYWGYKSTFQKVVLLENSLESAILFNTPKARTAAEETDLKKITDLHKQITVSEGVCKKRLEELNKMLGETKSLKDKFVQSLNNNDLHWAINRFVAIVDNKGQPLNSSNKLWNYFSNSRANVLVAPPEIPMPTKLEEPPPAPASNPTQAPVEEEEPGLFQRFLNIFAPENGGTG